MTEIQERSGRRRTRRGEETRRQLIEACIDCLNERGYAGTSIEAVMSKSGISRGSVLNQFPTRLDLMTATIETAMRAMMADTSARFARIADPVERLRRLCDVYWETQKLPLAAAVTEVLLAARWDTELASMLGRVTKEIEIELDAETRRRGMEAGVNDVEALVVHTRMLILSLRGMTLELMFDPDRQIIHHALEEIRASHDAFCDRMLSD
ncbi:TetR/AcrR family transcriptional regulator [uncultured Hyphomonas sp.]|uniref:TetR/AcrR family transcriptional regulator n=1 Tax=uncultured Hyphomonas sp. TaxID=225298 RepID=UPI002AAAA8E0|nr:TetR/AcrR family transcriptional regulator [uncultured Hyphomonas sp.]